MANPGYDPYSHPHFDPHAALEPTTYDWSQPQYGYAQPDATDPFTPPSYPGSYPGSGWENQNASWNTPQDQPERRSIRDRISMRGVALMAGVAVLTAGGVGTYEYVSSDKVAAASASPDGSSDAGRTEAYTPTRNLDPTTAELPAPVRADFQRAAAVDTCQTTVTPDQAADMYQKLFATQELPDLNDQELGVRIQQVTEQVESGRAEQGLIPLPANFAELQADAAGPHVIPVGEYQQSVTDYFNRFGITATFSWDRSQVIAGKRETYVAGTLANMGTPDTDSDGSLMRARIVQSMQEMSRLSPEVIRHIGPNGAQTTDTIAFGTITNPTASGTTDPRTGIIMIDTKKTNATDSPLNEKQVITVHEEAHADQLNLCGLMVKRAASGYGMETTDPAIVALNGDAEYGVPVEDELIRGNEPNGYTYMDSSYDTTDKIAYTRPYGAENAAEDVATTIGEHAFDPNGIVELMTAKGDMTIVHEKIALELARLSVAEPKVAEYYVALFNAARLAAAIEKQQASYEKTIDDAAASISELPDDTPGSPYYEAKANNQRLDARKQQLKDLIAATN